MTDLPKITEHSEVSKPGGNERTNIDYLIGRTNTAIYFLASAIQRLTDLVAVQDGGADEEILVRCEHEAVASLAAADLALQDVFSRICPEAGWSKQA